MIDAPLKLRILDVCNTILYSKDMQQVAAAYEVFFTQYRTMILLSGPAVCLSCVEDVIYKILYEEPVDTTEKYGYKFKYSPFPRFIAMVKDQENMKEKNLTYRRQNKQSTKPFSNLKDYLIIAPTDKEFEEKNTYIKDLLHQCYIKEI